MAQRREATDGVNQREGSARDPLASPTLAALYASQGHTDVAEVIYSQLDRRPGAAEAGSTGGEPPPRGARVSLLLEKLRALREAARQVREAGMPHAGLQTNHDR